MNRYACLFSIITVNYNDKAGLQRTIKSVLSQDFPDYEHIIIDAASTDGSIDIICEAQSLYPQGKFRYVSEKDNGIYDGMNKGVRMARGKFLSMMNAGDWLEEGALSHMALAVEQNPDINVFSGLQRFFEDVDGQLEPIFINQIYPRYFDRHVIHHQALFYHTSLHEKYGFYRQDLRIAADQAFFLELFMRRQVNFMQTNRVVSNFAPEGLGGGGEVFSFSGTAPCV